MLDFGALPPEINSARMYSGPGSGPLTAAAAAWEELAAQLESYAAGYSATLAELRGPAWSGDGPGRPPRPGPRRPPTRPRSPPLCHHMWWPPTEFSSPP